MIKAVYFNDYLMEKDSVFKLSSAIDEEIDKVFNEINIKIQKIEFVSSAKFREESENGVSAVIYSSIRNLEEGEGEEELKGNLVAVMPIQSALMLVDLLEGKEFNSTAFFTDKNIIPVKRTWNDLLLAYVQGINNYFKLKLDFNEPKLIATLKEYGLELCFKGLNREAEVLSISADFDVGGTRIQGKIHLTVYSPSLKKRIDLSEKK